MLTYREYKTEIDTFWSDVPHEKSKMVTKKKKRKKLLRMIPLNHVHVETKVKRTRKRKKRNPKSRIKKSQMTQVDSGGPGSEAACLTDVETKVSQPVMLPLYVKARTLFKVELEKPLNLQQLKETVAEKEKIPVNLQMLTHNGKLLRQSGMKLLDPSDTVHVIIRGKGGGKTTKKSKSGALELTSEADVEKWLKSTVKLPAKYLKSEYLQQLDGDTLMSYSDAEELYEELRLPKGWARKIIYLKENPPDRKIGGFTREALENLTTDDIVDFAKEKLGETQTISDIEEEAIRNECIDGFVMQLYEDHHALAIDLKIKVMLARKLLIYAKKQIKEKCSVTSSKESPSVSAKSIPSSKDVPLNDLFLSEKIGLRFLDGSNVSSDKTCQLFGIHNSWTERNKLGEMFLFWILSIDALTKQEKNRLWKDITSNIPMWLNTLPYEEKSNFSQGKSENKYLYRGGPPVSLRDTGSVIYKFDEITIEQRDSFRHHILILHDDMSSVTTSPHTLDGRTIIADHGQNKLWIFDKDGLRLVPSPRESSDSADGQSKDDQSKDDTYPLQYYGDMEQKYDNTKSRISSQSNETSVPSSSISFVHPRRFKQDSSTHVYYKDYLIDKPENGSGMISVSREFKLFTTSIGSGKSKQKFLDETLRFACGCLNRRRNGTIYFGVGDNQGRQKGEEYKHGQIVGFPILESDEDSKSFYIDALYKAKSTWFNSPEANTAAIQCIKDPVFVKVSSPSSRSLYVMEVDVEPSSAYCEGVKFKLDLTHVEGKRQGVDLYVRDSARTKRLKTSEEEIFMLKLKDVDKKRKFEEENSSPDTSLATESHKYLGEKLCRKLCRGERKFDLSFWPILMANKPTPEMKLSVYKTVNFISNVPWKAVFEFDDESSVNGLCSNFFPPSQTTFTDGKVFRNNENVNDLRNTLRIPEKNVVTFCNGRSDINKERLSKYDWKKNYFPNIKGAINFFQNTSVVPKGRAIIVCLLFSSDIEGYAETFGELLHFLASNKWC